MTDRLLTETENSLLNLNAHSTIFFIIYWILFLGIVLEVSAPA